MAQELDLLGDPIPANHGERGRPEHIPTAENRNKVIVLLALKWDPKKIASALGISKPTLRKHYSSELKVRDQARARLESALVMGVTAKALQGDVPAYREVQRVLEKADRLEEHQALQGAAPAPAPVRAEKLGKKEERQQAAEQVGGIFTPGPAPARLARH